MLEIDCGGNERRGLTSRYRREDGSEYVVAIPVLHFKTDVIAIDAQIVGCLFGVWS